MGTPATEPRTVTCEPRDVIRTPVEEHGRQRVLAVCERCGAFRDVTGVEADRVFALLHPALDLDGQVRDAAEVSS